MEWPSRTIGLPSPFPYFNSCRIPVGPLLDRVTPSPGRHGTLRKRRQVPNGPLAKQADFGTKSHRSRRRPGRQAGHAAYFSERFGVAAARRFAFAGPPGGRRDPGPARFSVCFCEPTGFTAPRTRGCRRAWTRLTIRCDGLPPIWAGWRFGRSAAGSWWPR